MLRDKTEVGYFVSTAQFGYKIPGSLPTGYGRESRDRRYQGGTIYNDATSSLIWVENQVSLGSNETMMVKSPFDKWLWDQSADIFSHCHSDNGIFTDTEYRHD